MKIKDLTTELNEVHQGNFVSTLSKGIKDIKSLYPKNKGDQTKAPVVKPKTSPLDGVNLRELKVLLKDVIDKKELDYNQLRFIQDLYRKL
jgi:hypothetical protein